MPYAYFSERTPVESLFCTVSREREERETFIDKFSTRFKTYCDQILIPSTFRVIIDALCVLFRKNARRIPVLYCIPLKKKKKKKKSFSPCV